MAKRIIGMCCKQRKYCPMRVNTSFDICRLDTLLLNWIHIRIHSLNLTGTEGMNHGQTMNCVVTFAIEWGWQTIQI